MKSPGARGHSARTSFMRLVRHPLWVHAIAPTLAIRAVVMVGAVLLMIVFASEAYQGDPFDLGEMGCAALLRDRQIRLRPAR